MKALAKAVGAINNPSRTIAALSAARLGVVGVSCRAFTRCFTWSPNRTLRASRATWQTSAGTVAGSVVTPVARSRAASQNS